MLICDTGPLYAVLNRKDEDHARCMRLFQSHPGPLVVPVPVLTEVCWLLEKRVGPEAEAAFLEAVADGELTMEGLQLGDIARMQALVVKYADFPLGAVDASVVAIAERLGTRQIATLDRRHFTAIRDSSGGHFVLAP
ncbi:VapC toxin family PIN domain ribonuclease [Spongiactinospora gelatinilytica]|uniref:Ribonuclease VapC n=1 Tax=Spongiactinospora gelatinilytica TaxID=2666298 RepID=A0A2W2INC2_9ACTN|nr:PIN domain-containing protein [Spongiactinospora gelatinilytica]PZG51354.1 VapC toxin family PIN domain ribonuclease [Spongiactinospora gelatinilytica]